MKKRFFYLEDINTVETVETMTKKELISHAEGFKNYTFCEHDEVISGYTKDRKFFYYDCTNFWNFKKSDIVNAISVVYSSESGYYVYGDYTVNMYGVVNPTEDGETLIWTGGNIKEVESADYTESEELAEEPAAVQEPEEETTATLKNYDEVKKQLIELIADFEIKKNSFQTDVYLYIDENGNGTLDTFVNVGGNSWINDDHITIYSDREHYETIMDELVGGDCGMWAGLMKDLKNTYGLSDVKEKVFNSLYAEMDEEDRAEYYKSLDDFESYDIEQTLKALYGDKIEEYYRDYFIPECCMDGITARAENALSDYE